jgi:hypothetical protein
VVDGAFGAIDDGTTARDPLCGPSTVDVRDLDLGFRRRMQ